jgi:hypothetical protein
VIEPKFKFLQAPDTAPNFKIYNTDMTEHDRRHSELYLSIATVEHHLLPHSTLSTYDIAERLVFVWRSIKEDIDSGALPSGVDCIRSINKRIAASLESESGELLNEHKWLLFTDACGSIKDNPEQVLSWLFSSLYWNHLTKFKFATAWLYMNALRVQYGLPAIHLTLQNLGRCLASLSGSGPPLYDGQTFYPDDYASPA